MGKYSEDAKFIYGLLGAGLDPNEGMNMFLQAKQGIDAERMAQEQQVQQMIAPSLATAGYGLDDIETQVGAIAPMIGRGQKFVNKTVDSYRPMYSQYGPDTSSLAALWDASDEVEVGTLVQNVMKSSPGYMTDRAALRDAVRSQLLEKLPSSLYMDMKDNIDRVIDTTYTALGGSAPTVEQDDPYMVQKAEQAGLSLDEYTGAQEGWFGYKNAQDKGGLFGSPANIADWVDDNLLFGAADSATRMFAGSPNPAVEDVTTGVSALPGLGADLAQAGLAYLVAPPIIGAVGKGAANVAGRMLPEALTGLVPKMLGDAGNMGALRGAYGTSTGGLNSLLGKIPGMGSKAAAAGETAVADVATAAGSPLEQLIAMGQGQKFSKLGSYWSDASAAGGGKLPFAGIGRYAGIGAMERGAGSEGLGAITKALGALEGPAAAAGAAGTTGTTGLNAESLIPRIESPSMVRPDIIPEPSAAPAWAKMSPPAPQTLRSTLNPNGGFEALVPPAPAAAALVPDEAGIPAAMELFRYDVINNLQGTIPEKVSQMMSEGLLTEQQVVNMVAGLERMGDLETAGLLKQLLGVGGGSPLGSAPIGAIPAVKTGNPKLTVRIPEQPAAETLQYQEMLQQVADAGYPNVGLDALKGLTPDDVHNALILARERETQQLMGGRSGLNFDDTAEMTKGSLDDLLRQPDDYVPTGLRDVEMTPTSEHLPGIKRRVPWSRDNRLINEWSAEAGRLPPRDPEAWVGEGPNPQTQDWLPKSMSNRLTRTTNLNTQLEQLRADQAYAAARGVSSTDRLEVLKARVTDRVEAGTLLQDLDAEKYARLSDAINRLGFPQVLGPEDVPFNEEKFLGELAAKAAHAGADQEAMGHIKTVIMEYTEWKRLEYFPKTNFLKDYWGANQAPEFAGNMLTTANNTGLDALGSQAPGAYDPGLSRGALDELKRGMR